jgi:hypothetical protein
MSEKRPSTCGRIASRSKAPALTRMKLLFATETQKWFAQKATSLSTRAGAGLRRALKAGERLGAIDDLLR